MLLFVSEEKERGPAKKAALASAMREILDESLMYPYQLNKSKILAESNFSRIQFALN
jgi:hypothetical protein